MQQKEVNKVFLYPVTMDSWGSDRGSEFPCSRLSVAMIHFLYCLLFWPDYINRSNTSPNSTPVPLMTVSNCTEYKNEKSELFKNMVLFKTDLITPAPLASALTKRYLLVKGPIYFGLNAPECVMSWLSENKINFHLWTFNPWTERCVTAALNTHECFKLIWVDTFPCGVQLNAFECRWWRSNPCVVQTSPQK